MKESLTKPDGDTEIPPSNLFNFDEANLSDNPGTKKCLFKRGVKYPERVKDSTKASISMMFCGSADECMLPAYVVHKAEHIWSTWTEGGRVVYVIAGLRVAGSTHQHLKIGSIPSF